VQGLGIVAGRGLEVVLTLGTGIGSAVFRDGRPTPHLELAQHPIRKDKTYDLYLGNAARLAITPEKWNRRVRRAIGIVRTLLNFDMLYLGGGNAECVKLDLPPDVKLADNSAGITGGVRLWEDGIWQAQSPAG
jgi:polyphosphate glucokinase